MRRRGVDRSRGRGVDRWRGMASAGWKAKLRLGTFSITKKNELDLHGLHAVGSWACGVIGLGHNVKCFLLKCMGG